MEDKTTLSRPVDPLKVAIIGTGDGSRLSSGDEATTAGEHVPNIIVTVIGPIRAILIRFVNVYVGMVVGLLGTAMASKVIDAPDFFHLVLKCASLAIGGAVVLFLKDILTIFGKLEQKFPLLTGSV